MKEVQRRLCTLNGGWLVGVGRQNYVGFEGDPGRVCTLPLSKTNYKKLLCLITFNYKSQSHPEYYKSHIVIFHGGSNLKIRYYHENKKIVVPKIYIKNHQLLCFNSIKIL